MRPKIKNEQRKHCLLQPPPLNFPMSSIPFKKSKQDVCRIFIDSLMQKARNNLMLRAFLMWSVIDGAKKRQLCV